MLTTQSQGTGPGRPLLIAHGLFGSARNWRVISKLLSDTRKVVAVDMRNHGESPWFSSHSYHDMARDLAEIIAEHGGKMDVLGHSMGGKAAMVLALTRPELVDRLIVADIAPVAYEHSQMHVLEAMRAVDIAEVTTRKSADSALAAHLEDAGTRAFVLQSLDLKSDPMMWRLNLDVLAKYMPDILSFPDIAGQFDGTTLFLNGANSEYVKSEYRPKIKAFFPNSHFAKLPETGHWLHAEKPREFAASVDLFLKR
ncbi:MAG: alpha/beta fold hydrolase [Halocynthiibacter sp.]